jgi:hypothetical protein
MQLGDGRGFDRDEIQSIAVLAADARGGGTRLGWAPGRHGFGRHIHLHFTAVAVYYDGTVSIRVTPKLPMASNQPVKMSVQHLGCDSYPGNAKAGKEFTSRIKP